MGEYAANHGLSRIEKYIAQETNNLCYRGYGTQTNSLCYKGTDTGTNGLLCYKGDRTQEPMVSYATGNRFRFLLHYRA